ncbi:MAG: hypothetical protein ACYTFD_18250, partial [Planctomycetota bacterium]
MRRAALLLLAAACATTAPVDRRQVRTLKRRADEALVRPDWPAVRMALEEAALLDPDDPVVALQLAETRLKAYGEVDGARRLYWGVRATSRARALHGLGLCALWEGDEERALELFEASLAEYPTPACARDLAVRRLGRGEDASRALDLVAATSGESLRSQLLLAAAGRRPRPARLPAGWSHGLERARLAAPEEAWAEVDAYLQAACCHARARETMARVLAGEFALQRNPDTPRE